MNSEQNTTMARVPDDHPLMVAWNEYKALPDYENTKQWATAPKHTEGSLWAAFMAGWYKARALTEQPASAAGVEGSEVVGHKTFSDGKGGFRHEPLTRAEADVLIAHCNSEDDRRKALIPDEKAAIELMMDTYIRLKEMGWNDAIYCPKDGRAFEVIEPGSTGIFKCVYQGEWPKGTWWIVEDGDMSPSRPVLFRPIAAPKPENS